MQTQKTTPKEILKIIDGKQTVIVGLRGSGKSYLIDEIAKEEPKHVFIDPLDEHKKGNRFVPSRRGRSLQLENEIRSFFAKMKTNKKIKLILGDEANHYFMSKAKPLPPEVQDLVDYSRHDGKTVTWNARRITQLPTDITELGDVYIFFKQTGRNDLNALDDIYSGAKEIMQTQITREEHNFILFDGNSLRVLKI